MYMYIYTGAHLKGTSRVNKIRSLYKTFLINYGSINIKKLCTFYIQSSLICRIKVPYKRVPLYLLGC